MFISITLLLILLSTCILCEYDYDSPPILPESMERLRDARSGCMCRVYEIGQYVTCFDTKKCTEYPKDIIITVPELRLSTTNIRVLKENDMIQHQQLTTFNLEMNDNFYRIDPGAFNNMSNIMNVSVSYNKNLQYLEKYTFRGLVNLKHLTLEKNGFHVLKDFTYAISHGVLPSLHRLTIASMPFDIVEADDFVMKNMTLKEFFFTTCQIKSINPEPFIDLKQLTVLDLSENILVHDNLRQLLKEILEEGIQLEELRLGNMGFNELPFELLTTISNSTIRKLRLTKNQFEVIKKFPNMSNIELLDLEDSVALNITSNAFDGLPNLKYLLLSGNRFSDIPCAILLPNIEHLDISYAGKYFSLEGISFANMINLKHLNLSGNNIRKLAFSTFKGLAKLQVLILQDCSIFFVNSSTFHPLKNLIHLDLQNNPFPSRDVQRGIFNGLWKLETLKLGKCSFENISKFSYVFYNLTTLTHLSLENNEIKSIKGNILAPLVNLEFLNLSSNDLMAWDEEMFAKNNHIKYLNLNNNKIKDVTVAMLQDFDHLTELDLNNNPFMCRCPDINILYDAYLKMEYGNLFRLIGESNLSCGYPKEWSNRKIIEFLAEIGTDEDCKQHLTYLAPLITCTIVFIFMTIVVFLYRWHIRYWLFLTKLYLSRSGRVVYNRRSKVPTQYEYDAFVSYSNEDQSFVIGLVNALETIEPFYKLCVYERDFQIGTVISETVLESVAKSRKTLLIVSEAYIKSTWCRWEVQVAENKRLFWENENGECVNDSLVIVKLGDISTRHLNPMLKYLMKTRVYLEWDTIDPQKQSAFWCKLRNTLAKTKT